MRLIIIILSFLLLSGCANKQSPKIGINNDAGYVSQESSDKYSENEKAKSIVQEILKLNGVEKAVVVVNKNIALIGIKLQNVSEDNRQYFKDIAVAKVKKIAPEISNAEVTFDDAMYNRISRLNNDISKGKPLDGIKDDFNNILKRNFAK